MVPGFVPELGYRRFKRRNNPYYATLTTQQLEGLL